MSKYEKPKTQVEYKNCQHLTQQSFYINASGTVSNCCYFNNRRDADDITQLVDIKQEIKGTLNATCLFHCGS